MLGRTPPKRHPILVTNDGDEDREFDDLAKFDAMQSEAINRDIPVAQLQREEINKRLSRAFGNKTLRRNQLVARLKRSRGYDKPIRGGTGKQGRTRRRKFSKHLPGQHDQLLHGRRQMERLPFTSGPSPTMWSAYGVKRPFEPDRLPSYTPVVTPDTAEQFFADHGLDHVYYGSHASDDPEAVMSEGFHLDEVSEFVGWGKGVYMVHEDAEDYDETSEAYAAQQGSSMRLAMGFENPLIVHAEDPNVDTYIAMANSGAMGAEFHYAGPGEHPLDRYKIITEWADIEWDPEWDAPIPVTVEGRTIVNSPTRYKPSDKYPGTAKLLLDAGYDGLIINAPKNYPQEFAAAGHLPGFPRADAPRDEIENFVKDSLASMYFDDGRSAPGTGGSQAIAFDPEHVFVVGLTDYTVGSMGRKDPLYDRLEEVSKHLPGQHDQLTHGNRGNASQPDIPRTDEMYPMKYPGDCYERAGLNILNGEGFNDKLVHGLIGSASQGGFVAHAWVEKADGSIYEGVSDSIYHPDDFDRLFHPEVFVRYSSRDAISLMQTTKHFGGWDPISDAWYDTYNSSIAMTGHVRASTRATVAVTEDFGEDLDRIRSDSDDMAEWAADIIFDKDFDYGNDDDGY